MRLIFSRKSKFHFTVVGKPVMDWASLATGFMLIFTGVVFLFYGIVLSNAISNTQYCSIAMPSVIVTLCLLSAGSMFGVAFVVCFAIYWWLRYGDPLGSPSGSDDGSNSTPTDNQTTDDSRDAIAEASVDSLTWLKFLVSLPKTDVKVTQRWGENINVSPSDWKPDQIVCWLRNMGYASSIKDYQSGTYPNFKDLAQLGSDEEKKVSIQYCVSNMSLEKPFVVSDKDIQTFDCLDMLNLLTACGIDDASGIVEKYALNGLYFQSFNDSPKLHTMLGLEVRSSKIDREKLTFLFDIMSGAYPANFFRPENRAYYYGMTTSDLTTNWLPHNGLSQYSSKFVKTGVFGALLSRFAEVDFDDLDDIYHELGIDIDLHATSLDVAIELIEDGYKSVDEVADWVRSNGFDDLVGNIKKYSIHGALLQFCLEDQELFARFFPSLIGDNLRSQAFMALAGDWVPDYGKYVPKESRKQRKKSSKTRRKNTTVGSTDL